MPLTKPTFKRRAGQKIEVCIGEIEINKIIGNFGFKVNDFYFT